MYKGMLSREREDEVGQQSPAHLLGDRINEPHIEILLCPDTCSDENRGK